MSGQRHTVQDLLNADCEVFRSGNHVTEFLKLIQILVVEAVQDFARNYRVKPAEIADHPSLGRDGAADSDFKKVVVAVSVRMVAFSIGLTIGRVAERSMSMRARG